MIRRSIVVAVLLACVVPCSAVRAQAPEARLEFKTGVGEKAQGFMRFMETIQKMASVVKDVAGGAAKGIGGGAASLGAAGDLLVQGIVAAIARGVKEPAVRELVLAIGARLGDVVRTIGEEGFSAARLVGHIVSVAEPLALFALEQLPFPDASLRRLFSDGLSGILRALRDPAGFKAAFLDKPWAMVKAALQSVREFVRDKLGGLVMQAHLGPERDLLIGTVDSIFDLLVDDARRGAFLSGKSGATPLLELLVGVAKPYLSARLNGLVAGTGLESIVEAVLGALFGPKGPIIAGAAFFTGFQQTLKTRAGALLGEILTALSGFLEAQVQRAGQGPIVGGLLRGLLRAASKVLASPEGLAGLARKGAAGVIAHAGEVVGPLIEALAPQGQTSPALGFVRTVVSGLIKVIGNAAGLAQKPAEVLRSLGAAIAQAAKGAVQPLVAAWPIDATVKKLLERGVAALFELLSSTKKQAAGTSFVSALRAGAAVLLPIVRTQLNRGLPPALATLSAALITELTKLVADPRRVQALHAGKMSDLVARAFEVFGRPAATLVQAALPASVRALAKPILRDIVAAMTSPARLKQLGTEAISSFLPALKAAGLQLLGGVLALVPAAPKALITTALASVSAALANPASLTSALATAARTALDQTLSALVLRVPEGAARELALGLTAILRDLVGAERDGQALRAAAGKLFARLLSMGARVFAAAVTEVVPEGAMRTLLRLCADGLGALANAPKGIADAQARPAATHFVGVIAALASALRAGARAAIADPAAATLIDSLFEAGLSALLRPSQFAALLKGGVEGLLARVVPIFRDFMLTAIGRGVGDPTARGFVESILRAAVEMFAAKKGTAPKAAPAGIERLVGFGISTVKNLVMQLIGNAGLSPAVSSTVSGLFTWLGDLVSQPALLATTLRKKGGELLSKAISGGQALLAGIVTGAVRDPALGELIGGAIKTLGTALAKTLAGTGAGDLGLGVRDILIGAVGTLAKFFRGKLLALFGGQKGGVAQLFVGEAYDGLTTFAADMLQSAGGWQKHMGAAASAGKVLFGKLARWAFGVLTRAVGPSITHPALRGLTERLLSAVGEQLGNLDQLTQAVRTAAGAARLLLPRLVSVVKPLLEQEIVGRLPAGLLRTILGAALNEGLALLGDVDALARVPAMKLPDAMKKAAAFLKTHVVPPVVAALKLGGVVQGLINAGLDRLTAAVK